jgi:2-iminoacetate synthase ThiH
MDHARLLSDDELERVLRERALARDTEMTIEEGIHPTWPWLASLKFPSGATLMSSGGENRREALEELFRSVDQADELGLP